VAAMVEQMDAEGFGGCTNTGVCATVCPKGIPLAVISRMNGDLLKAHRP
jgi:succinate dehydrogenase / fumarate reductase iron-sulfur subunit